MIITRVELKNPRFIDGTSYHQLRNDQGFSLEIKDGLIHATRKGQTIYIPVSDLATAYGEPGGVKPTLARLSPEGASAALSDPDKTVVTKMPKKGGSQ